MVGRRNSGQCRVSKGSSWNRDRKDKEPPGSIIARRVATINKALVSRKRERARGERERERKRRGRKRKTSKEGLMLFASILLFLLPIFLFPPFLRAIVPYGPLDIKTTRAIQVQQILFCFQVIAGFTTALSHGLARLAFRFRKQKHRTKRGAKINRMSTCFVLFMSFFFLSQSIKVEEIVT